MDVVVGWVVPGAGSTVRPSVSPSTTPEASTGPVCPDAAAGELTDRLTPASVSSQTTDTFPYLGEPYSGYYTPDATPPAPPAF